MANYSFDIESTLDKAELNNVFEQVKRDISNRYDFKGTPASIEWLDDNHDGFKITGSHDYQLEAIIQLIRLSLGKRGQSQKLLDVSSEAVNSNLKVVKDLSFKQGLDGDKAKAISKLVREQLPKIKVIIQGPTLRVSSNSKDELQKVMTIVRAADLDYPVQFTNFH
jgi:hypothetical protein